MRSPALYVIAGANGAGKTTFAKEFLPRFAHCPEFVNADLIAQGLSPFSAVGAALEAGRIMLGRISELAAQRRNFAFETTLSGRGYLPMLRKFQAQGYRVHLFYLWVPSVQLAVQRVRDRVRQGGHDVPEADIRHRFKRSLRNLFLEYMPVSDTWTIWDNSQRQPQMIAYARENEAQILDGEVFGRIKRGWGRI